MNKLPRSEEVREKISQSMTEKWVYDQDYCQRVSEGQKRAWKTRRNRGRKVEVVTYNGLLRFPTIRDCAKHFGISEDSIRWRVISPTYPQFYYEQQGE